MIAVKLTGRVRYRAYKPFGKQVLLVAQVEYHRTGREFYPPVRGFREVNSKEWRDARVEDMAELGLEQ